MQLSRNKITLLDGAMGTMLQKNGITLDVIPETVNIKNPEVVIDIHRQYVESGSDIIYANTFAVNRYKTSGCEYSVSELISAGIKNAKAAAGNRALVALDIGPIGQLMEPHGTLCFDEAYDIFSEIIKCGVSAGADLVVLETFSDLLEIKAALLAVKENSSLPVFCTMTFEENGRTFAGVPISAMAVTLSGLGADAIGINCSLGPKQILPLAAELVKWTDLPIIVKPNAGLPDLFSGQYFLSAEEFAEIMAEYADLGIAIMGGCCGTTPEFIKKLRQTLSDKIPVTAERIPVSAVCSGHQTVNITSPVIVGERINPTGKKQFKQALLEHNMDYILRQGIEQVNAGAGILDVNVGLPEIDECAFMTETIKQLQSTIDVPLQIDSSDPVVLEQALRIYNGKPIINSVNGEARSMAAVLPLAKKYGAAVIGLTLDENGIPDSAEERFKIAERIVNAALEIGIAREDIYIDCLTLTASVQQEQAAETLKAMTMVKSRLGVKTVLGVSNISFGLPERSYINSAFLVLALCHGLDLAIINPNLPEMTGAFDAFNVLYMNDVGAKTYISNHSDTAVNTVTVQEDISLESAILAGLKDSVKTATEKLLKELDPIDIINNILIPALDEVGMNFENGITFLPQLIKSASAAQAAFDIIKSKFDKSDISKGTIVIATVYGDIHDIGKNIVKVILENYGYNIIDLGKNVPPEKVVDAVLKSNAPLVGLSALMTTTVPAMAETIALLKANTNCKIMVGGAVLTPQYSKEIGADYYAKDAKASVDIAKSVIS